MLSYILNNCSMGKCTIIIIVVAMISFAVNETLFVTSQNNSTNLDKQKITVIWLEDNKPKTDTVPAISISGEDFWKIFKTLLEQSNK
jgi:hypothetical protein